MAWANTIDELSPAARFLAGIGRKGIRGMDEAEAVALSPSAPSLRPQVQPKEQAAVPIEAIMAGSRIQPPPDAIANVDEEGMHEAAASARQNFLDSKRATPAPKSSDYQPGWVSSLIAAAATFGAALQRNPNALKVGQDLAWDPFNKKMADWETEQAQIDKEQKAFDTGEARYRSSQDYKVRRRSQERQDKLVESQIKENEAQAKEREAAATERTAKANQPPKPDRPKTLQEGLFSEDPATRKRSEDLFRYEHRDRSGDGNGGGKPKDYAAQKRVIEDDIGTKMQNHKKQLQDDIDKINKNRAAGLYTDDQYKQKMAELERRDYQTMREIGKDKQRQYGALGEKIDAPEPAAWEKSFVSDNEKPKAKADPSAGATGTSTPSAQASQGASQPQQRTVKGPKGEKITVEVRNGKWVDVKTGKPI